MRSPSKADAESTKGQKAKGCDGGWEVGQSDQSIQGHFID